MTNGTAKYEYMDDVNVDSELICIICKKPFAEPIATPCDHTFCRECLHPWLEKKKKSCPTCRYAIKSIDQCTQVNRPLRNMLNRLRVKCSTCGQTDLLKESFHDHTNKSCPKQSVVCPAANIKCPWKGVREDLAQHQSGCPYEALRPLLTDLIRTNEQLTKDNQQLTNEVNQLSEQKSKANAQINELANKLSTLNNGNYDVSVIVDTNVSLLSFLLALPVLEDALDVKTNSIMDFSNQKITDEDLAALVPKTLVKSCFALQLSSNAITSSGLTTLADALAKHPTAIEELWLSNNCIGDVGVTHLVDCYLSINTTLKHLHLGANCIGDAGLIYLAELLEYNKVLTDLWLFNNQISDEGVQNLAKVLWRRNRSIKHVDLQWNREITDRSLEFLVKALESNPALKRLNMRKCGLSIAGKMKLLQAISEKSDFKLYI